MYILVAFRFISFWRFWKRVQSVHCIHEYIHGIDNPGCLLRFKICWISMSMLEEVVDHIYIPRAFRINRVV